MNQLEWLKFQRSIIIKKWKDSGILDAPEIVSNINIAQLLESKASALINEREVSMMDTISYFEGRLVGAQIAEHKIRPLQQLISVMICNILNKHCL
jgi:hypothetical protein